MLPKVVHTVLLLAIFVLPFSACQKPTAPNTLQDPLTIYIVRHAEKQKDGTRDPSLTPIGRKRAENIRRLLSSVRLQGFYATHLKRTQQTIQPTAKAQRAELQILQASDLNGLYKRITQHKPGASILVSGHSSTVPALIQKLGIKRKITLKEKTDYDDVFIVLWRADQASQLLRLHAGPHPPQSTTSKPSRK